MIESTIIRILLTLQILSQCLCFQNIPVTPYSKNIRMYASFFRFRERIGKIFRSEVEEEKKFPQHDAYAEQNPEYLEAPEILTDDICLLPGEPIIRIELAPQNSRRIFTGIDILADIDSVWKVLTAYESLHLVVPSLIKNEVLERYADGGARLYQVGGANVLPGITFKASVTLDVRIYLEDNPLPPEKFHSYLAENNTNSNKASSSYTLLQRGIFPRPYALTSLPHRDITMQNIEGEGDFEHYQGIWRMQQLPNCAPNGGDATRLTYAVEIRPKGFLPVALIEKRVASDLSANLEAIRTYVESQYKPHEDMSLNLFERNLRTDSIDENGVVAVLVNEVRDLRRRVEVLEKEVRLKNQLLQKVGESIVRGTK